MAWLALVLRLAWPWSADYAEPVAAAARKYKLDPLLVSAVIYGESRFSPAACRNGSHGLMQVQLKPRSCSSTLLDALSQGLYVPEINIDRGAKLMAWWRGWWRRHHQHDGYHWLLHYNQGFGRCPSDRKCRLRDRIPVTSGRLGGYAERVLKIYRMLQALKLKHVTS